MQSNLSSSFDFGFTEVLAVFLIGAESQIIDVGHDENRLYVFQLYVCVDVWLSTLRNRKTHREALCELGPLVGGGRCCSFFITLRPSFLPSSPFDFSFSLPSSSCFSSCNLLSSRWSALRAGARRVGVRMKGLPWLALKPVPVGCPKPQYPGTWTVRIGVFHSLWVVVTGSSLEKCYIHVTRCMSNLFLCVSIFSQIRQTGPRRGQMYQWIAGGSVGGGFWPWDAPGRALSQPFQGKNQIQKDGPSSVQFCFELALCFAVQCLSRTFRRLEEALGFSVCIWLVSQRGGGVFTMMELKCWLCRLWWRRHQPALPTERRAPNPGREHPEIIRSSLFLAICVSSSSVASLCEFIHWQGRGGVPRTVPHSSVARFNKKPHIS